MANIYRFKSAMEGNSQPQSGPSSPADASGGGSEQQQEQRMYSLPGLQGEWTLQQLVDMELQRDPRLAQVVPARRSARAFHLLQTPLSHWHRLGSSPEQVRRKALPPEFWDVGSSPEQVRRKALPPEFWDARRRALNHKRLQRNYGRRKRRGEALRQEEEERLAGMDEEQQAEYKRQKEEQREAAKAAAAQQRELVAQAMQSGLRVVVDCSFSADPPAVQGDGGAPAADSEAGSPPSSLTPAASDREVRSLCKQLELCAAANKRAPRPVCLQFSSFSGRVRAFALEGMHADRWPAARGHDAPLQQLFPGSELVVLSPDAQAPLLSLDPAKAGRRPRGGGAQVPLCAGHGKHCAVMPLRPRNTVRTRAHAHQSSCCRCT
jgi:hypothetical protein